MRLPVALEPVSRRPAIPLWAAMIVGFWLGLVAVYVWLSRSVADAPPMCMFRNITGLPCPTCGTTRAVLAGADGRFADALLLNPFVSAAAVILLIWLVLRIGFARRLRIEHSPRTRWAIWGAIGLAFILNWGYLIWREAG